MKNNFLKKILCLGILLLSFSACGGKEDPPPNPSNDSSATGPNAGNLPPPNGGLALQSQNTIFFQQKDVWDGFSDGLKKEVEDNYSQSGGMMGAGAGGHGYYNTLFGRVSPTFGSPSSFPPITAQGAGGKKTTFVVMADTIGCDVATAFCASDQPRTAAIRWWTPSWSKAPSIWTRSQYSIRVIRVIPLRGIPSFWFPSFAKRETRWEAIP
jgi:hypothetical protein